MFSKIYIVPPLVFTLNYIVLNYWLLDSTCFIYAEGQFHQSPTCKTKGWLLQKSLSMSGKNVSTSTVRRRLCATGYNGRIVVKKPLLKKQNNVKRLQWVNTHKDWTIEQWNKVLWTDGSKFEIFGSNRKVFGQWRVSKKTTTLYVTPTIEHGGDSVMV